MNLRDKIFNTQDIQEELVPVKAWDVTILVKGLSGTERAKIMNQSIKVQGKTASMDFEKLYPELIIMTSYDPDTKQRIFEPTDRELLNSKSGAVLEQLAQVAIKLSGLRNEDMEIAEKN